MRQRHFPYRHPTFGSRQTPKPQSAWKGSVYYWWWAFLRLNPDYLACCEAGGGGALEKVYRDFGDVRPDNFKEWWSEKIDGVERGVALFAEPDVEETVRILQGGDLAPNDADVVTVCLPMYLPKRFIETRLKQIVGKLHKGKRGRQNAKQSKARYTFRGQPNVPALAMAFTVYAYWLENPKKKLWEIGNDVPRLLVTQKVTDARAVEHALNKRALAATVSRYLKRAKAMIENTARGTFP